MASNKDMNNEEEFVPKRIAMLHHGPHRRSANTFFSHSLNLFRDVTIFIV